MNLLVRQHICVVLRKCVVCVTMWYHKSLPRLAAKMGTRRPNALVDSDASCGSERECALVANAGMCQPYVSLSGERGCAPA